MSGRLANLVAMGSEVLSGWANATIGIRGCIGLPILSAVFAWFVWPTPWRIEQAGPDTVRVHRLTGRTEILGRQGPVPDGGGMGASSSIPFSSSDVSEQPPVITQTELGRIKGRAGLGRFGTDFSGTLYNGNSHALKGDVLFHIEIKDRKGRVVEERDFRETVDWPAQKAVDVSVRTDLTLENGQSLGWWLLPVP